MTEEVDNTVEEKYWYHHPNFFSKEEVDVQKLYYYVKQKVASSKVTMYEKTFDNPRLSCVFINDDQKINKGKDVSPLFSYEQLPQFNFNENEIILYLKNTLENFLKQIEYKSKIDYCLCHIYRNGNDYIGWHADREAKLTPVISVSFGATRKFRLREKNKTKGCDYEYSLNSGDLFIMKPGCQMYYKHSVPKELKIKDWRINLTFRMKD